MGALKLLSGRVLQSGTVQCSRRFRIGAEVVHCRIPRGHISLLALQYFCGTTVQISVVIRVGQMFSTSDPTYLFRFLSCDKW